MVMKQIMLILALAICLCPLAFGEGKTATSDDAWVQVNRACALREAPESDAEAVAKAPKDAELDYIGKSPDGKWYHVRYKGVSAWIEAKDGALKWATFY